MRFFAFITLFSLFLLCWNNPFDTASRPAKKALPALIKSRQKSFKASFEYPQNANVLWAILTGEKNGITPKTQKSFTDLELNFLFSPSGIHYAAFLGLIFLFVKKRLPKKYGQVFQWIFLTLSCFIPYLAIKRIIYLRILIMTFRLFKMKVQIELVFLLVFLLAFLLGHYDQSPVGFVMSFFYMGTFIALRDQSKLTVLIGLFSTHLIINLFSGSEISFFSLIINMPLLALFSFLLPLFYFYFLSFQWIHYNWVEWIIRSFIVGVKWIALLVQGTSIGSSIFLVLAVWIILLKKKKRFLILFLLLHGNAVNSPAIFT